MTQYSDIQELAPDERFYFDCRPEVVCFNQCCRDLSQALTPYDVLRLRHHLNMTSSAFLEQFTRRRIGPRTGLPVVSLKPLESAGQACPFVTPSGCGVYPDRPSSCRMYPVFRAAVRQRETGRISERWLLIREPHCRGFDRGREWTAPQWIAEQGLEPYNSANDEMLALISAKNRAMPGAMDKEAMQWVYTACYDSDRLREAAGADMLPGEPGKRLTDQLTAAADDPDWLTAGMAFVRQYVFGEKPGADHGVN